MKILLVLPVFTLFLTSCQNEVEPKIEASGIVATDPVAELISAVAMKDGSADNIIDESSCVTVIFPISGELEDQLIEFNSLEEVEELGAGALEIDWIFPWNVILTNHRVVTLSTEDELEIIQDACIEGGNDADIECVDFIYPFNIQIFDNRTESVTTKPISNDKEAFQTFTSSDLFITIEYPVILTDNTGATIQTNSDEELINTIASRENSCDEKDLIDFEEVISEELIKLFTSSSWKVSLYEENGMDNTELFEAYSFQFNEDFSLQANGPTIVEGEWEIELLDTNEAVYIEFFTEEEPLALLTENWIIIDHQPELIILEALESDVGSKRLQPSIN